MSNKRPNIVTIVLLIMTLGLMFSIFYIGSILLNTSGPEKTSPVAPRKIKAQNITYSKIIALDITATSTPTITQSPTPTEIILAKNPSVTEISSPSATPTKTATLPATGFINNALVIFSVAFLLVLFSFLF